MAGFFLTNIKGVIWLITVMTTPTGYAEMFEWADGNPDNEDRAGCTVALVLGDRIRIAQPFDRVIGVIGGDNTSVAAVSGGNPHEWHGKHLRDPVHRLVWEKQTMIEWIDKGYRHWYEADKIPEGIAPPDNAVLYDISPVNGYPLMREILTEQFKHPKKEILPYQPRWDRREWAIVVLLGRAMVRENSVCPPAWIKLKDSPHKLDGIGLAEWLVK